MKIYSLALALCALHSGVEETIAYVYPMPGREMGANGFGRETYDVNDVRPSKHGDGYGPYAGGYGRGYGGYGGGYGRYGSGYGGRYGYYEKPATVTEKTADGAIDQRSELNGAHQLNREQYGIGPYAGGYAGGLSRYGGGYGGLSRYGYGRGYGSGYGYGRGVDGKVTSDMVLANIWDRFDVSPVLVQGSSLRTWSFTTSAIERVGVFLKSEGRPINANVELWQGPDNTPQKISVYIENGNLRPFSAVIETPRENNAVCIRNTAKMELPVIAAVEAELEGEGYGYGRGGYGRGGYGGFRGGGYFSELYAATRSLYETGLRKTIQGNAIHTYPFSPAVDSVQVLLKTDGRPLNARIELLQGPNNKKQVIDVYSEDGWERPFFAVLETPGTGNVVRVVNTATMEYPMTATVEPYMIEPVMDEAMERANDSSGLFSVE